ncbi:MAG: valine--tRNA ligase [Planctomycetes bacterium]|nr:valine--tRNA ligase [Planctomycetota bacterium]
MTEDAPQAGRYDPAAVEDRWYRFWEDGGYFHEEPDAPGEPFSIVIPPPNVTGVLHMGHALDNTFQDLITRLRRMQGRKVLWLPGTDHAGIATQNVVERKLKKEGMRRADLGRERFLEKVWEWKEEHGSTIVRQLRRLGASCDWSRERFTMDEGLSRAVVEVFCRLHEKGLIYRGEYLVNWCPRCATALTIEEAIHKDVAGAMYSIRYPVKGEPGRHVTVATTRPETLLGDTAVAVHPEDVRYRDLVGRTVVLPFVGREIPVVADAFVDRAFGTGCLKITPGHDPNDFELGQRHGLARVNVLRADGTINENGGEFQGLDRFEARERVVQRLQEEGLYAGRQDHVHPVAHCQRCGTILEPWLSTQWFVRMKPLAGPAMAAVREGRVRFTPERWEHVYFQWMEGIRDWCISRQLWWGHRIPAWHCRSHGCGGITVARSTPSACARCGGGDLEQDPDVLDTWFSSWLWPFSTMGWPGDTADLRTFYPTRTLVTGPDIIFFWVARMIMAGIEFTGQAPFDTVYLHGMVKDDQGRIMSKSLGNGIDPIEMIERYSADALRFSLVMLTAEGQDARLAVEKFEMGRNFTNKLWNASRFVLGRLEGCPGPLAAPRPGEGLLEEDRWILSRLHRSVALVTDRFERYRFNEGLHLLHAFVWHDLCDWYIEAVKPRLAGGEPGQARSAGATLAHVLDVALRLLHPVTPFVTEEVWQRLRPYTGDLATALIVAAWPRSDAAWVDDALETDMARVQELIRGVRNVRKRYELAPGAGLDLVVSARDAAVARAVSARAGLLERMAGLARLEVGTGLARPRASAAIVLGDAAGYVPLAGVIDVAAERRRLEARAGEERAHRDRIAAKLAEPRFVERAPAAVVERERAGLARSEEALASLAAAIEELG